MDDLKESILANQFIYDLRLKFQINEDEYLHLYHDLENLKTEWQNQTLINKELVQHLYVLLLTVAGQLQRSEYSPSDHDRIQQLYIELENVVMECLQ